MADKITIGQERGKNPKGEVAEVLIDGTAYQWDTPLAANEEKSTGWIEIGAYKSLHYIIQSDVGGTIQALEYSTDGTSVSAGGTARAYEGNGMLLQTFVALKDNYFRIRYKNGSTAQTKFFFEARLSTSVGQNTMNSVFLPITPTNVASITKSVIELSDGTSYAQIGRVGDALKVEVVGGQHSTDVSGLATSDRQDSLNDLISAYSQVAATASKQDALLAAFNAEDFASQTTLAQILAKIIGNPATEAKQDATITVLNSVLSKLIAAPSTAANQEALNILATAIRDKITANAATEATLNSLYQKVNSGTLAVSGTFYQATQPISAASLPLPSSAATSTLQTATNAAIGGLNDAAVTDPTQSGSLIALIKGLLQETISQATTGSVTRYSLTAGVQQTAATNLNAKGRLVYSESGTILIGLGFTASATNYSVRIVTNGFYEVPVNMAGVPISLFAAANSTALITTTT